MTHNALNNKIFYSIVYTVGYFSKWIKLLFCLSRSFLSWLRSSPYEACYLYLERQKYSEFDSNSNCLSFLLQNQKFLGKWWPPVFSSMVTMRQLQSPYSSLKSQKNWSGVTIANSLLEMKLSATFLASVLGKYWVSNCKLLVPKRTVKMDGKSTTWVARTTVWRILVI